MYPRSIAALILLALLLAACSSGGPSALQDSVDETTATYQIIDLNDGSSSSAAEIPDLLSNPRYRSTHLVFRLLPQGNATLGAAPGSFASQLDETSHQVSLPRFYITVFELTQAQWRLLAGTEPWTDLQWASGSEPVTAIGDELPAYGLSIDLISEALIGWLARSGRHFQLPTDDQWEYACRAGTQGLYSWGDARTRSEAETHALVFETQGEQAGPGIVGQRSANAWGLYDMHGNCWEPTSDHHLRGGSWYDSISLARAANRSPIDPDSPHALVGVRLLYLP